MVQIKLIEETDQRLVYTIGAMAMLCHMSFCTLIAALVSASLTLFLRHHIGIFAYVFVALPGLIVVVCGVFGCANSRQFTFIFDRAQGSFAACAGSARLTRQLHEIRLIHIERECGAGGLFGSDAPGFAATLLFTDGRRCRLEGGVSMVGSGKGPEHLQAAAEKIRVFLNLPQINVPLLNVSRASKEEEDQHGEASQAEAGLMRWLACQGIAPRLEPPLAAFDWLEPPEGPVRLPGGLGLGPTAAAVPGGPRSPSQQQQRWARPGSLGPLAGPGMVLDPGLGPVVVGRPQPQPAARALQVTIPEGPPGQILTVTAPDGAQVTVTVPADMRPGEPLTVQY